MGMEVKIGVIFWNPSSSDYEDRDQFGPGPRNRWNSDSKKLLQFSPVSPLVSSIFVTILTNLKTCLKNADIYGDGG